MQIADNFANVRVGQRQGKRRPSRVSVPEKAHPFAKLVFARMRQSDVRYDELEARSGVLASTFKAWRGWANTPSLVAVEACLGALGYTLVPTPKPETLPPEIREALQGIAHYFSSEEEALGVAIAAAAAWPSFAKARQPEILKMAAAA